MNRHTKLALFIAPFLIIGGYIAADFYSSHKASKKKYMHQLKLEGDCIPTKTPCVLTGGGLTLKLSEKAGQTIIESSYPLETLVISQVYDGEDSPRQLKADVNKLNWSIETKNYALTDSSQTLRIATTVQNQYFISEFKASF